MENVPLTITSLYRRPDTDVPPEEAREVGLLNRVGISRDCHANTLSPRQVLIVFDDSYSRRSLPEGSLPFPQLTKTRQTGIINRDYFTVNNRGFCAHTYIL